MVAKNTAFEQLYENHGGKGGNRKLYGLAKIRERKARNLDQVRCIKDGEWRIKSEEVEGAMQKMSRGKATGSDEIPMEFHKEVGRSSSEWLTGLFNVIFRMKKIPEDWP
ncbi:uncharacterized protein LOC142178111 [Nicotiana tabacum]|uniref:Uncharacterized protein LOC142178111 n=1 Tax=Nicotiana tabacum TaxID=4097 RepID=A0AC58U240_TOBAC